MVTNTLPLASSERISPPTLAMLTVFPAPRAPPRRQARRRFPVLNREMRAVLNALRRRYAALPLASASTTKAIQTAVGHRQMWVGGKQRGPRPKIGARTRSQCCVASL